MYWGILVASSQTFFPNSEIGIIISCVIWDCFKAAITAHQRTTIQNIFKISAQITHNAQSQIVFKKSVTDKSFETAHSTVKVKSQIFTSLSLTVKSVVTQVIHFQETNMKNIQKLKASIA